LSHLKSPISVIQISRDGGATRFATIQNRMSSVETALENDTRKLKQLRGIGPKMLEDFERLGIHSVAQLRTKDAGQLYKGISDLTGARQDPCVLDTYRCAIEQARDPDLPEERTNWWYWSRLRKSQR
jgi:hypothetical protein